MEKTHTLAPTIKWAQRKDKVYMTVEIRDIKNEKIDLQPANLSFVGESDEKHYEFKIDFFEDIDVEASKWSKFGFHLQFILVKKSDEGKYWPRLIKENKKQQNIHVDWDKYVDEDDEAEEGQKGLGGNQWDPSNMQGFGGAQPGGEEDEDDEGEGEGVDDLEGEEELNEQKGEHVHGDDCKHEQPESPKFGESTKLAEPPVAAAEKAE